jgi:hypothetical protein
MSIRTPLNDIEEITKADPALSEPLRRAKNEEWHRIGLASDISTPAEEGRLIKKIYRDVVSLVNQSVVLTPVQKQKVSALADNDKIGVFSSASK